MNLDINKILLFFIINTMRDGMSSRRVDCQDEDTYSIRVLDEKGNYLIREVYPG